MANHLRELLGDTSEFRVREQGNTRIYTWAGLNPGPIAALAEGTYYPGGLGPLVMNEIGCPRIASVIAIDGKSVAYCMLFDQSKIMKESQDLSYASSLGYWSCATIPEFQSKGFNRQNVRAIMDYLQIKPFCDEYVAYAQGHIDERIERYSGMFCEPFDPASVVY